MSANVVFVNIDWKESRHHRTLNANMKVLAKTITDIVQKMNPTVICMCEVGETKNPLSEEQMQQVADKSISAWKDAATEHVKLRSMFTTGAPYMTIYVSGPFQCSDQQILHDLYYAGGEARTAQAFVLSGPGGGSIDVINVHAPSGTKKLKDNERRSLLTSLLQSNSQARPGLTIGNVQFLIGGDMNTAPILMSQLLQACRDNRSLHTEARTHETDFAKHGDLCIAGGIQASTLKTTAPNHDPKHDPYGICWSMPKRTAPSYGYATEQSSPAQMAQSPWPRQRTVPGSVWNEPPAAPASGSATEQPLPTRPAPRNTQPHRQTLPTTAPTPETTVQASVRNEPRAAPAGGSATEQPLPAPTLEPAMQARLELETLEKRAQEHELSDSEIELALDRILKPEDFLQESQEGAAPTAAAAATEHSEETTSLPAEKQLIYSIVNAFLNKMTFHHPQAEELLVAALNDETCLTPSICFHVQEVFSQIFFYYPNGLKDRSVWEPRDTSQYIRQWYQLASMREMVIPRAAATEHGIELSRTEVSQIFTRYMDDMKKTLRPDQQGKKWTYYKGCAEAKMRREAGHVFIANAIWAIGLPRLPQFATDQARSSATEQRQDAQLSAQDLEALPWAIQSVLEWLDRVAVALLDHGTTPEYQEALRKSGIAHGQSALSATEQETRAANRKAKFEMHIAKQLAKEYDTGVLTMDNCHHWQFKLLQAYWEGSLHKPLRQVTSAESMCRTPSLARGSATEQTIH
jgi:endonuclease/exonuclease/phosphatase family metal-dependent hydrolase